MGTDTYPRDMISEMRWASIICKIEDANHEAAPATAVFNAATLGGADALRRPDLGRLQPGAKPISRSSTSPPCAPDPCAIRSARSCTPRPASASTP